MVSFYLFFSSNDKNSSRLSYVVLHLLISVNKTRVDLCSFRIAGGPVCGIHDLRTDNAQARIPLEG